MTTLTQVELDALSPQAQREVVSRGVVECPECRESHAWLGDQGACIALHGKCLTCLLFNDYPRLGTDPEEEREADAKVAEVQALREQRERWAGRRVFPCPSHVVPHCPLCHDAGWILGYPPGRAPAG